MNNLGWRIAVAAVGIPLLLFAATFGSWLLVVLVAAIQLLMLAEWRRIWSARGVRLFLPGLLLGALGLSSLAATGDFARTGAFALLGVALMFLSEVFRGHRQPLAHLGAASLFLLYVTVPLSLWIAMNRVSGALRFAPAGALAVILVTTWACDSAAYFAGRFLGRHKLYPAASPNKTVEGLIAGVVFSAIVLPILSALNLAAPRPADYAALPLIVGGVGQAGDLLESLMKREADIKDTSTLLPGHGGLLDRFDSLLLSTPFFFAYLLITSV